MGPLRVCARGAHTDAGYRHRKMKAISVQLAMIAVLGGEYRGCIAHPALSLEINTPPLKKDGSDSSGISRGEMRRVIP
jgi:hypothetical protein